MNPKVDQFLNNATIWKEEMTLLRTIVHDSELTEDYKWMHPCYTFYMLALGLRQFIAEPDAAKGGTYGGSYDLYFSC